MRKSKKNNEPPEEKISEWTEKGLKLMAVKVFNDYCLALQSHQRPEAESFFEAWINKYLNKNTHKYSSKIWKIFIDMLWERTKH